MLFAVQKRLAKTPYWDSRAFWLKLCSYRAQKASKLVVHGTFLFVEISQNPCIPGDVGVDSTLKRPRKCG